LVVIVDISLKFELSFYRFYNIFFNKNNLKYNNNNYHFRDYYSFLEELILYGRDLIASPIQDLVN